MRKSEMDDRGEPFGMPFTNREVAVIVANDLSRHDRGLWFYEVERHIDDKRWIIARKAATPHDPVRVFALIGLMALAHYGSPN